MHVSYLQPHSVPELPASSLQDLDKINISKIAISAVSRDRKISENCLQYFNCTCMGRFDTSGTSKNDNLLKVLVGHGVKKYGIEIFFRGLQAEICLFVYIL